ncbi:MULTISPECIES: TRAP transporter large permease [Marinobacter]|uniref:TRAP transporter large permease n=1 Tax=Marinobacter TaxID=2742 RepID=UPI000DAD0CA3|nr:MULTISPECIES: TRAP transporter large permease [Marinobacter]
MGALISIGAVIVLMLLGVPVVFSFAAMVASLAFFYDVNVAFLATTGFSSINSIILVALPLFVMTGYLMQEGGIAARLVRFVEALTGHSRAGMGSSMVVACGIFGAISGTASAAVASVGSIMVGPMQKHGYNRAYVSGLLGISSLLGLLIPPSITMILYAVVTRQSVAACFLATIGPGILLMFFLCIYNYLTTQLNPAEAGKARVIGNRLREIGDTGWKAVPALMLPVIILGGIYGGVFTPTEAAAVAVAYAIPVGLFVYKGLDYKKILKCLVCAATTSGVIVIILFFSFIVSRILTFEAIPQQLTSFLLETLENKVVILLMVNVFLILLGMIMDDISVIAIASPLLVPVMAELGIDPIHFAAIIGTSVVIGCNSPPMAPILFMSCRVADVSVAKALRPALALMLFTALPVMLIVTFWSPLALTLPGVMGYLD